MTARGAKPGAKSGAKPTQRCGGIFQADPEIPADPLTGDQFCRCGLAGEAGDAHHAPPAGPDRDVQQLRAGEGGER